MNRISKKIFVGLAVAGLLLSVAGMATASNHRKHEPAGEVGRGPAEGRADKGRVVAKEKGEKTKGKEKGGEEEAGKQKAGKEKAGKEKTGKEKTGKEKAGPEKTASGANVAGIVHEAKAERRAILAEHGGDHRAAQGALKAHREATRAKIRATLSAQQDLRLDGAREMRVGP